MRQEAEQLLKRLAFDIDLDQQVSHLTRAQKQMVEIAKALRTSPNVLILDEPTASLTDGEAEKLFDAIAQLKRAGVGIVYVSHRMSEIRHLSDRVTVLRGGRKIGTVNTAQVSDEGLIEMMVGRPMGQLFPEISYAPGKVAVQVRGLSTVDGAVREASLVAKAGEVVGLAGLVGCGRSELCRAIFGLTSIKDGTIELFGEAVPRPHPHSMLERGLCYFPPDRGAEGLALSRPVRENVTMSSLDLRSLKTGPFLDILRERRVVREPLQELKLRPLSPESPVSSFSGGNQQKAMLARGLIRDYGVYVFDEPTVGIDVGAKADVYQFIKRLVERGACVILSTSELPELINLSSRIYVMHQSSVVAELHGDEKTEAAVLSHYFGNSAEERRQQ
jgi:ribose transport system ATP-binding protein